MGDVMPVVPHHAVAQANNHLHLSAANRLAPLVRHHNMIRGFWSIQLALYPRLWSLYASERYPLQLH